MASPAQHVAAALRAARVQGLLGAGMAWLLLEDVGQPLNRRRELMGLLPGTLSLQLEVPRRARQSLRRELIIAAAGKAQGPTAGQQTAAASGSGSGSGAGAGSGVRAASGSGAGSGGQGAQKASGALPRSCGDEALSDLALFAYVDCRRFRTRIAACLSSFVKSKPLNPYQYQHMLTISVNADTMLWRPWRWRWTPTSRAAVPCSSRAPRAWRA